MKHDINDFNSVSFYNKAGFCGRVGFGDRPAILVIDLAEAWTNPENTLGSDLSSVVTHTCTILHKAREMNVPIAFTTTTYEDELANLPMNVQKKVPHIVELKESSPLVKLHPSLERNPQKEPLVKKPRASAFFGTNLLAILINWHIDTVIIVGCSTSGCIRSTAESAHNYGFHTIVVQEAVGDRSVFAHKANLFDIDARMADVVTISEVIKYLDSKDINK